MKGGAERRATGIGGKLAGVSAVLAVKDQALATGNVVPVLPCLKIKLKSR